MMSSILLSQATIENAQYTRKDQCPRFEFTIDGRSAFISEIRKDYFQRGFVKLFSFDLDINWETLLPIEYIRIEDREVKLMGYTNDPRIRTMAKKFNDELENGTFTVSFKPDLKALFANITQL